MSVLIIIALVLGYLIVATIFRTVLMYLHRCPGSWWRPSGACGCYTVAW